MFSEPGELGSAMKDYSLRRTLVSLCAAMAFAMAWLGWTESLRASQFTVATFNLENYVTEPSGTRPVKPERSRNKVREIIRALHADVLGLQEVGGASALEELRASLKKEGLEYPHAELVIGADTNIQVAVLSRFPITARHSHSEDGFLLGGRRHRLARGIAEVDIQIGPNYSLTLFVAHLKSRRPAAEADEEEIREQEAVVLREKIDARLRESPEMNLVVVGDLNDAKDSRTIRAIIGKGKSMLVDTRPSERNGDHPPVANRRGTWRNITWTHFYAKEDTYSRFDYILLSRGIEREWDSAATYLLAVPNWGIASDHRPLLATFEAEDR
jgi:endonuclease/exonuclease/phosphatase family metal-dependent hydrolase